uniref:Uncharacterized protein n=1 Tax=Oryza sativa subsp. japonica TaxID=39947 RepID=Q6KAF2_ORYSJ|nr:hypothetical protein [Oryza sativa Japonica Group]
MSGSKCLSSSTSVAEFGSFVVTVVSSSASVCGRPGRLVFSWQPLRCHFYSHDEDVEHLFLRCPKPVTVKLGTGDEERRNVHGLVATNGMAPSVFVAAVFGISVVGAVVDLRSSRGLSASGFYHLQRPV